MAKYWPRTVRNNGMLRSFHVRGIELLLLSTWRTPEWGRTVLKIAEGIFWKQNATFVNEAAFWNAHVPTECIVVDDTYLINSNNLGSETLIFLAKFHDKCMIGTILL